MFMTRLPKSTVLEKRPRMPTGSDIQFSSMERAAAVLQAERARMMAATPLLGEPKNTYENRTVKQSYKLAVFHDGQESDMEEFCPVFVHRPTTLSQPNDVITAMSLPHINYYCEMAVRDRGSVVRQPVDVLRKTRATSNEFYTYSIDEFLEKWNFQGSLDIKPQLAKNYTEGGTISPYINPGVVVNTAGVITLKQVFGESLQPNDHLYWLVKPVDSPYRAFYGLKGETVAPKTPYGTSFLQVLAFSEKDTVIPYPNTARKHDQDPLLWDRCGMARNQKLSELYRIVEYDELNGYNFRPAEDVDVPDIVADLYQEGAVHPVGIVQRVDPRPVSYELRLQAHRDMEKLKSLPNVTVIRNAATVY